VQPPLIARQPAAQSVTDERIATQQCLHNNLQPVLKKEIFQVYQKHPFFVSLQPRNKTIGILPCFKILLLNN
jgi:hypothetical protein